MQADKLKISTEQIFELAQADRCATDLIPNQHGWDGMTALQRQAFARAYMSAREERLRTIETVNSWLQ